MKSNINIKTEASSTFNTSNNMPGQLNVSSVAINDPKQESNLPESDPISTNVKRGRKPRARRYEPKGPIFTLDSLEEGANAPEIDDEKLVSTLMKHNLNKASKLIYSLFWIY